MYFSNPTQIVEAIKQNRWLLEYVRHQTPEICLAAVKQNGYALQYVEDQNPELCLEAIKQNINARKYIKIPLTDQLIYEIVFETI